MDVYFSQVTLLSLKNGNPSDRPLLGEFPAVDKTKISKFHDNFCVIIKEEIAAIYSELSIVT